MNNLITFTPYLGDSFLTNAITNKIQSLKGEEVQLLALDDTMATIIRNDWGGSCVNSAFHNAFMKEGSLFNEKAELKAVRVSGAWQYTYLVEKDYEAMLTNIINCILDDFTGSTIYTLHNTYPHARLGQLALSRGITVYGYFLASDNKLYLNTTLGTQNADIWTDEYIGDRLSRIATGRGLSRSDFTCQHPASSKKQNVVTLFPATRGQATNAGNWETDVMYLQELGYDVRVAVHTAEKSIFHGSKVSKQIFSSVAGMVDLITSSEFIICHDSIAFHLAWHYRTKAIVKMKAGFNREWHPKWLDDSIQFIPPTTYFQEEYLHVLKPLIQKLIQEA